MTGFYFFFIVPLNKLVCCSLGPNQPALIFKPANKIYLSRGASVSSSSELFQELGMGCLASSLMRFMSCFFFGLGQTHALFLMPTANLSLHLVVLLDLRENQGNSSSEILSSVSPAEILSAIEFSFETARTWIWSCFRALASSLRQMNLPPAPSNPQTIARLTNCDRRSDYRRQQPDTRGSHDRAGY